MKPVKSVRTSSKSLSDAQNADASWRPRLGSLETPKIFVLKISGLDNGSVPS